MFEVLLGFDSIFPWQFMLGIMALKTIHSEGFCTRPIFMYLNFDIVVLKDLTKLISVFCCNKVINFSSTTLSVL